MACKEARMPGGPQQWTEREARMLALTWRLEVLAAEQRGQRDGGDD
jgi:hypothetical protein